MKFALKLQLTFGALATLMAAPAFAGLDCDGSFFGYDFHVTAATANNKVTGPVTLVVSQGDDTPQKGEMTVVTSSIVPGKSLSLKAKDSSGASLDLNTTFQGGNYQGPMSIGNSQGTATPDMTCKLN